MGQPMYQPGSRHKTIMDRNLAVIPFTDPCPNVPKSDGEKPFCFDPLAPTIFHEDWWLDAATGGKFKVAEVAVAGRTVGRLPFHTTKHFGLTTIRMPALTYFLGPAIDEGEGSPNTRFRKRLKITRELLEKLPQASWQYVKCQGGITDVIAFQELSFRTYVQFTYEIMPDAVEVLWQQLRTKTRTVIRKAEEQLVVTEWNDPAEFVRLHEQNLEEKGLENGIDGTLCQKIISASLNKKRGRILAARDKQNQVVAANFCVWDGTASYYLMSTRSDHSGNTVSSLLLWESIKESARRGLVFDFAGLGNKGSVSLYSGFGASVGARYVAVRARPLARLVHEMKSLIAPENYFY
jgi:hypothetical protein